MSLRAPIDAVLFDLDGVLLDTEPLYTRATIEVVAPFGKSFEWSLKRRIMGRGQLESARIVARELELPISPEEYLLRTDAVLKRLFEETPAMPGAAELLTELVSTRLAIAIATSTPRHLYELKVRAHPWIAPVTVVVCGDDPEVESPKPAPDIFLAAAKRLGVASDRCVVIEDSPNGVLAARRAGMQVVALPDPRLDEPILDTTELVARSPLDVREALAAFYG